MGATGRFGGRLRRVLVLGLVLGGLGAAAGWWTGHRQAESHEATVVVLVSPLQGNPFSPDSREGLLNLETEARLVTSDAVARAVVEKGAATGTVAAVVGAISVEVPANTQLLRITATNRDPTTASRLADAFAQSYLDYRATRTAATVFDRRAHLTEELSSMRAELADLTAERESRPVGSPRRAVLDQQVAGLVAQVAQVQTEQTSLGYVSQDPGQVVTPAQVARAALLPAPVLWAIAGGGLGLLLAVAGSFGGTRRNARVGSMLDLAVAGHEEVRAVDDIAAVRARVLGVFPLRPMVVLVVGIDTVATEPVDQFVEGLARARQQTVHVRMGHQTRDPAEPEAQDAAEEPRFDFLHVLAGDASIDKAIERIDDFHSEIRVGAGRDSADLLASPELSHVVAELRGRADVVVFSETCLPGADAELLLAHVDVVLLWTTAGVSTYASLEAAQRLVAESPATLAGVVHDPRAGSRRIPRRDRETR